MHIRVGTWVFSPKVLARIECNFADDKFSQLEGSTEGKAHTIIARGELKIGNRQHDMTWLVLASGVRNVTSSATQLAVKSPSIVDKTPCLVSRIINGKWFSTIPYPYQYDRIQTSLHNRRSTVG